MRGQQTRPAPDKTLFGEGFVQHLEGLQLLSAADAARALAAHRVSGNRFDQVVRTLGLLADGELMRALADYLAIPLFAREDLPATPVAIPSISTGYLRRNGLLPLTDDGETIRAATIDPLARDAVDALAYAADRNVKLSLIDRTDFSWALQQLYGNFDQEDAGAESHLVANLSEADVQRLQDLASDAPTIRMVDDILSEAARARASDVHVEPLEQSLRVRYRVDGMLQLALDLPGTAGPAVISRIKVMSQLDIAERRTPQDGRIRTSVNGRQIDLRVATIPGAHGESAVIRLLDRSGEKHDLEDLGFDVAQTGMLQRILRLPDGIVFVTGPTGSGKTTTLYAAMSMPVVTLTGLANNCLSCARSHGAHF